MFPPAATPTGVAVIGSDVYVALFVTGQLMRVSLDGWTQGDDPVDAIEVLGELDGPHTLLVRSDGTLWSSQHLTGNIVEVVVG